MDTLDDTSLGNTLRVQICNVFGQPLNKKTNLVISPYFSFNNKTPLIIFLKNYLTRSTVKAY